MAESPSYEAARDELIEVVQKLETGGTSLQESIALWERGEELAQVCQRWLDGARARLDAVMQGAEAQQPTPPSEDEAQ
jgi:exodeoxyribonuclease VII small subunit